MAARMEIRKSDGTWVVRAGGAVIGETRDALELHEQGHSAIVYIPRDDIAMAFLDRTDSVTRCPRKGDATYYSVQTNSATLDDVAWSYETPREEAAMIAGHIAFRDDRVTVEKV